MRTRSKLFIIGFVVAGLAFGLADFAASAAPAVTEKVVVSNLDRPWAVTAGPDGNIWVAEIDGRVKIYTPAFVLQRELTSFPDISPYGQGGLMDIVFHPDFASNNLVYFTYTVETAGKHHSQVNRFKYSGGQLSERKVILNGPTGDDGAHFGSRLVFGRDGKLYASFGERHEKEKAPIATEMHGKVARVNDDGTIPQDNPFGPTNPVFTKGHRNPQGLDMNPVTGELYVSEHGPTGYDAPPGGDEVNHLKAGSDYGWPTYHHTTSAAGFVAPLLQYTPSIAPSGIVFYTGSAIPAWKNDLFVSALAGAHLLRVRLAADGSVVETEKLLPRRYGRIRDVGTSPDGSLLVVTDNGDLVQLK